MRDAPVTAVDPPPPVTARLNPRPRMAAVQAIFLGVALLIVGQLVRWQIVKRDELLEGVVQAQPYMEEIPSYRGLILDRNESVLALNNYDYTIEATPRQIPERDKERVAIKLSAILDRPVDELLQKIAGDAMWAQVAWRVPRQVGKSVKALHLRGILVKPVATRIYPERTLAAHVLGFVAGDEEEGSKGYYGVEGFYDTALKGKSGMRNERWDPWSPVSFADWRARNWTIPEDGRTLVLTIDRTIQYLVEEELRNAVARYGAEGGSIVVMDPKTGALLAVASYPTYDPNHFGQTSQDLFTDPVVGVQYEPGSTFKIVTMAAALDAGAVRPTDVYNDVGHIEVGGRVLRNWDEGANGPVTMTDIMVHSLNTGIAHVSTVLGPELFYQYVGRFGFGHETRADLEGEVAGSVRQPGDPEWHESDLGTNAFGQGLAVTPLQLVTAVSAVANRGVMMRPYVVEAMTKDGRTVHARRISAGQVIRSDTARIVTEMMVQVVEEGATQAQVEGYRVAGKTGTAQTPVVGGYDPNLTIASFIGFAPADDPAFVVLVKLDKPTASQWGAATAAPTFANVARMLFTQLEIPPDELRWAMD